MKKIYKGPMRRLIVSNLEVIDKNVKILEYETPIVQKDLMFYINRFGAFISFEHNTRLPDFGEATDYIKDEIIRRGDNPTPPYPTCPFVDEGDIEFSHEIDNSVFKVLKKYYRNLEKENKKK